MGEQGRSWTVRNVSDDVRELVRQAAKEEGVTVSRWVTKTLHEAAMTQLRKGNHIEDKGVRRQLDKIENQLEKMDWFLRFMVHPENTMASKPFGGEEILKRPTPQNFEI
ncbi:hypothetical protein ACQZV8_10695 [Magnetococcales bacterium HHB-1]